MFILADSKEKNILVEHFNIFDNPDKVGSSSFVKMVKAGNVTEFVLFAKDNMEFPITKIDKDHYMLNDTGEIFEYKHASDKSESYQSVRRSLSKLRGIINSNCIYCERIKFLTLTYSENMTDTKRLYKDFKNFWLRFKRWHLKQFDYLPEYIAVAEPQGRGAWHMHILLVYDRKAPFIDNQDVIEKLWTFGWTYTKAVNGVDNLGAYFSAYLADMPLEEFKKIASAGAVYQVKDVSEFHISGSPPDKKFVKGARLCLYPSGMNIFRCSKGIKKPSVEWISYGAYEKEKANSGKLTFSNGSSIFSVDESGQKDFLQTVVHIYYNKGLK